MPPEVDPSVFWYTFSAIPQTLASAFAFLLAVILYRIQATEGTLSKIARSIAELHLGGGISNETRQAYEIGDWDDWRKNVDLDWKKWVARYETGGDRYPEKNREAYEAIRKRFEDHYGSLATIRSQLVTPLKLTVTTVCLSFFLLMLTTRSLLKALGIAIPSACMLVLVVLAICTIWSFATLVATSVGVSLTGGPENYPERYK